MPQEQGQNGIKVRYGPGISGHLPCVYMVLDTLGHAGRQRPGQRFNCSSRLNNALSPLAYNQGLQNQVAGKAKEMSTHRFVGRARSEDELIEGVEPQAIDLRFVRHDCLAHGCKQIMPM